MPVHIGPAAYAAWRATSLGTITERLEHRLILEMAGGVAGQRVLDVGCGDGALACTLARHGAEVVGVDADPAMLEAARRRADEGAGHAEFAEGHAERLSFPDDSFDVVVAVTVLCFVGDASGAISEMVRVLRPNGRLVLGDLGRWSAWTAVRVVAGWRGSAIWRSARFRTAAELRVLLQGAGVHEVTTRGSIYYPPVGAVARVLARPDPALGRLTTVGAAFIAVSGTKRA